MENAFGNVCVINMTEAGNEPEKPVQQSYNGDKSLIRQRKLSGKAVEALNVLESWLDAVDVDVSEPSNPEAHLSVRGATGSIDIVIVDNATEAPNDAIGVSAKALTSSKHSVVMEAFHTVTEAAGFGKPVPVFRGEEIEGRAKVFELIAMRHKEFRMAPNEAMEALKPYEQIINRCVGAIYKANHKLFALYQYEIDDLKTYAQIYAMSWIHRYKARGEDANENIRLLTDRVQKRLVEFIGVLRRQGRNVFHDSETSNVGMYGSVFDREEEALLTPDDSSGAVEAVHDSGQEVMSVIDSKLAEMGTEKAIAFLTDFAKTTDDKDVRRCAKTKLRELKAQAKEQKRLLRLKK